MGKRKQFTQGQKLSILESVKENGIKKAAKLSGIHYTTIYDWKKRF